MINKLSAENKIRLGIISIGLLVFCAFNGLVHLFDWDEINFAESAREMIVTGNYSTVQINFVPFWEKPPLYIWFQVMSMKLFGINEFAARFPNAICGIITLLILFETGRKLKDYKFGLFWAVAYGASILPFLYFKSGIIDPWFNLSIFLSLYFAFRHFNSNDDSPKSKINLLLSAVALGLAVLTKGPVAVLLLGVTLIIYLAIARKFRLLKATDLLLWGTITLLVGGSYHLYQFMIGNSTLILDFFKYQLLLLKTEDAGHGGSFLYHPLVLFLGVFPSSILALSMLFGKTGRDGFGLPMVVLFWVVLVIFSLVRTKIVHYSSLCYFPISFLAATALYQISERQLTLSRFTKAALWSVGSVYALVPLVLQAVTIPGLHVWLRKIVKDDSLIDCLSRTVPWSGYEFAIGLVLLLLLVASHFFADLKKLLLIYGSTVLFVLLTLLFVLPKVEAYSQGAAIQFIENVRAQDSSARINSLWYKSYAPLFYSKKSNRSCSLPDENECLLNDILAEDIYFVAKTTQLAEILAAYPQLEIVKKEGGFVLLHRIY